MRRLFREKALMRGGKRGADRGRRRRRRVRRSLVNLTLIWLDLAVFARFGAEAITAFDAFFEIYTGTPICHKSAVRLAIPLLILCLASSSMASEQAKKGADKDQESRITKILHPDKTLAYYSGDHRLGGMKSFGTNSARSKGFNFSQKFHPNEYASEKGYKGSKSDWKGDTKFTTKAASTEGKREIVNADRKAPTKGAPTKEDWQSSKKAPAHDSQYAKREFLGPDAKKVHENVPLSKQDSWKGDLHPMTIDEVRDLLNKPKL